MRSTMVFLLVLPFVVSIGSMIYSSSCYGKYRDLLPQRPSVGLLTGIRAWLAPVWHDPRDQSVSDECKKYLKRYKIGTATSFVAMTLFFLVTVVVRLFGLQDVLLGG